MMHVPHRLGRLLVALLVVAGAAAFVLGSSVLTGPAGEARLIAFEPLPEFADETCEWEVASPQLSSYAAAGASAAQMPPADARMAVTSRAPATFIQDPYPSFSSIAVDPVRN